MQASLPDDRRPRNKSITPGRVVQKGKGRALKLKQHEVLMSNDNNASPDLSEEWLLSALTSLGHPQPESHSKNIHTDNEVFQRLVEWLEDRCIRLWDLERRDQILRPSHIHYFELQLPLYLQALECPPSYYTIKDWHKVPKQRYRVIHWVVSCAMQEAFQDQQKQSKKPSDSIDTTAFPLGFSTGDDEVDHVLTVLRMELVSAMSAEQRVINAAVLQAANRTTNSEAEPKLKASFQRRKNHGT